MSATPLHAVGFAISLAVGAAAFAAPARAADRAVQDLCLERWQSSSVMQEYCRQAQSRAAEQVSRYSRTRTDAPQDADRLRQCQRRWPMDMEQRLRCLDLPPQIVSVAR